RSPEVNCLRTAGKQRLIFQAGELQARICEERTRDAQLIVSFVHRPEISPAVRQYRLCCRVEAVQQHLAFFETVGRPIKFPPKDLHHLGCVCLDPRRCRPWSEPRYCLPSFLTAGPPFSVRTTGLASFKSTAKQTV